MYIFMKYKLLYKHSIYSFRPGFYRPYYLLGENKADFMRRQGFPNYGLRPH